MLNTYTYGQVVEQQLQHLAELSQHWPFVVLFSSSPSHIRPVDRRGKTRTPAALPPTCSFAEGKCFGIGSAIYRGPSRIRSTIQGSLAVSISCTCTIFIALVFFFLNCFLSFGFSVFALCFRCDRSSVPFVYPRLAQDFSRSFELVAHTSFRTKEVNQVTTNPCKIS